MCLPCFPLPGCSIGEVLTGIYEWGEDMLSLISLLKPLEQVRLVISRDVQSHGDMFKLGVRSSPWKGLRAGSSCDSKPQIQRLRHDTSWWLGLTMTSPQARTPLEPVPPDEETRGLETSLSKHFICLHVNWELLGS